MNCRSYTPFRFIGRSINNNDVTVRNASTCTAKTRASRLFHLFAEEYDDDDEMRVNSWLFSPNTFATTDIYYYVYT